MLTDKEGQILLSFARECVYSKLFSKNLEISSTIKKFNSKQGVFVTIHKNGDLRGCIGFVIGHFPLYEGIKKVSHSAAFDDPRFNPIDKTEWDKLKFEISVLTIPEMIMGDVLSQIKVGRDGLIVEYNGYAGLLLPQVASEWKWNEKEFLEHTCEKAGIAKNMWQEKDTIVKKFQAQVFSE